MPTIEFNYRDMLIEDVLVLLGTEPALATEVAVKQTLRATGRTILPHVVADISAAVERKRHVPSTAS